MFCPIRPISLKTFATAMGLITLAGCATNPQEADVGTIRADFAETIDANAVHGSDSAESAKREIAYFFGAIELCASTC